MILGVGMTGRKIDQHAHDQVTRSLVDSIETACIEIAAAHGDEIRRTRPGTNEVDGHGASPAD